MIQKMPVELEGDDEGAGARGAAGWAGAGRGGGGADCGAAGVEGY